MSLGHRITVLLCSLTTMQSRAWHRFVSMTAAPKSGVHNDLKVVRGVSN